MVLSKQTLSSLPVGALQLPSEALFDLPEKVLQFGTGVLLRGLPDFFIDKANRQGIFNGRVVVVKSTDGGDANAFDAQDGLYTICVRGIENGQKVEETIVSSAISRVLSAKSAWGQVLECAASAEMKIIISNTTEVGIQLVNEDIHLAPPASFPGKLLAFLYRRFQVFKGSSESGMVIVPTELITDNGKKLKGILLELARFNKLEAAFVEWLETDNRFCNSLVDRIVPGKPKGAALNKINTALGYEDELLIMSEVYRLWAIEGDEFVKSVLSFATADEGVVITPDITLHKELKLRLLNGTHTLSCALAFLQGFKTVKNAMDDEQMSRFIQELMLQELAPSIPYKVDEETARIFGNKVLDRFSNPHIEHFWISISMQYTSKLKMRVLQLIENYCHEHQAAPAHMSTGFAAYLVFTRPVKVENGKYLARWKDEEYPINDDAAEFFYKAWQSQESPELIVHSILANKELWGSDLNELPGFTEAVQRKVMAKLESGVTF